MVDSKQAVATGNRLSLLLSVILFLPLGLLPLIKGSVLFLCGSIVVLCAAYFLLKHRVQLAIVAIVSPLVSLVLFWVMAGQSVVDLPAYFLSMAPMVSGFTEGMAKNGSSWEILLYLTAAAILLLGVFLKSEDSIESIRLSAHLVCIISEFPLN